MSYLNRPVYSITPVFCALLLLVSIAEGADSPGKNDRFQPRAFEAAVRSGETIGWQQMRRVFVTWETNEFVLIAPHGFRIIANPKSVALVSADSAYFLAFRILTTATAELDPENTAFHRAFVMQQFPAAKVIEEFSKTAAGRNGPAFELQTRIAGGTERSVCVALIPFPAGVLEFSLNSDLSKASDAKAAFNSLLRTFQRNERGKLEITARGPDHS